MKRIFPSHSSGVALIVTLMMMSVLVMMVVGLAGVMRNEQAAARNLTYQVLAEQMADLGAREAMAVVLSNSRGSIGRPTATGPGWMFTNGPTRLLCSSNDGGLLKNLDEIGTNSLILSLPDGVRGTVAAAWSNVTVPGGANNAPPIGRYAWWVDDEGTKANLNAVGSNNTNLYLPLLTRFPISSDWIFSDPITFTNFNATPDRARFLRQRLGPLPTTESVKDETMVVPSGGNNIGDTSYRRAKGHITAWSSNVDLTPWGSPKFNLADLKVTNAASRDAAYALIRGAMTTNAWTNFFGGQTLASKYGTFFLDQIAANIYAVATTNLAGTNPNTMLPVNLGAGYGNLDTNRHRQNLPISPISQHAGPYLNQVRLLVDRTNTANTATVRLNFGVQIFNPNRLDMGGYRLEIQPRKFRFQVLIDRPGLGANASVLPSQPNNYYRAMVLINTSAPIPLTQPNLYVRDADWMNLAGGNPTNNWKPTSYWIGPEWNETGGDTPNGDLEPFPTNPPITAGLIGSNNYPNAVVNQTIGVSFANGMVVQAVGNNAYVMLDQIILRRISDNQVMDWLSFDDFSQQGNYRQNNNIKNDNGQLNVAIVDRGSNDPVWADFGADGLWKTDPQARFPNSLWDSTNRGVFVTNGILPAGFSGRAWKRVTEAFDCTSSNGAVTGVSYLNPDPVATGTAFNSHPHLVPGYLPTNGIKSIAQLGAIHTGLPWRTLRLGPTPAAELAQGPPDWVLLDLFTATSPTASLPMINLNGLPMAMPGGTMGVAANANGTVSSKSLALISAMASAALPVSPPNTNQLASNGVPFSLTNASAAYGNLAGVAVNLRTVLTSPSNASGWSGNSGWRSVRTNPAVYPANGMLFRGELLEVGGVAEDTNIPATGGEDVVEGRLRSFLDLITTRSDTFTVWSAGQGLVVNTNRTPFRTNVMGEVRKQTVFQRSPATNNNGSWQTNAQGQVTNWTVKLLYTRNHVVE